MNKIIQNVCLIMDNGLYDVIIKTGKMFTLQDYTEKTGKTITLTLTNNVTSTTFFCSWKNYKGDLTECILGTMAIPGVFSATEIDNETFFDGGFYNNYPIDYFDKKDKDGKLLKYCNNVLGFYLNNFSNLQPNDVLKHNFYFVWKFKKFNDKHMEILKKCFEKFEEHNDSLQIHPLTLIHRMYYMNNPLSKKWDVKKIENDDVFFEKELHDVIDEFRKQSYGLVTTDDDFKFIIDIFKNFLQYVESIIFKVVEPTKKIIKIHPNSGD